MTRNKLVLFKKFLEDLKGIKPRKAYIFRFDEDIFADYNSLHIGKTKICLQ